MHVVEVASFGGPEVLQFKEIPDVQPGPGAVAIEVAVSGVQTLDGTLRRGLGGDYFPVQPPYIPGMEAAGVVTTGGPGVDPDWVGRRVLASLTSGGYATRVVTSDPIPVPDSLGLREAMALLHDGSTALALLEATPVSAGESVLVQPAAGGLATLLIQLLVSRGARVIAAARGPQKLALAKELGASVVIDYTTPDWPSAVGTVDVAFDGVGGPLSRTAFESIRPGGRFSNYGNASGTTSPITVTEALSLNITMQPIDQLAAFRPESPRRITQILHLAAEAKIRPILGHTYPLAQASDAHTAMEARTTTGKTLLIP